MVFISITLLQSERFVSQVISSGPTIPAKLLPRRQHRIAISDGDDIRSIVYPSKGIDCFLYRTLNLILLSDIGVNSYTLM